MLPYYFLAAQIFGFGLPTVTISHIHAISTSVVVGLRLDDPYFNAIFLFLKFTELEFWTIRSWFNKLLMCWLSAMQIPTFSCCKTLDEISQNSMFVIRTESESILMYNFTLYWMWGWTNISMSHINQVYG